MKCETVRNMMSSYIDKDLNNIEKGELEKHLTECKGCKEEYESLLDIITACGNLEEVELPQNFRTELHQRLVEEKRNKNLFGSILGKKPMKMASGLVAAVLVIAIGIGSFQLIFNNNAKIARTEDSSASYSGAAEYAVPSEAKTAVNKAKGEEYDIAAAEAPKAPYLDEITTTARDSANVEFSESQSNESVMFSRAAPSQSIESSRSGRMVIRTGNISVNVESVDKAATDIRQLTESSGGYVENSQIDNVTVPLLQDVNGRPETKEATEKYASLTIRVPEAKFANAFDDIKGMGKLVSENTSGSDVTAEYRDTEARVDNLTIQEQSLKQLMTKAKNVDEILKIESELNRVRTDIDIYSGNLKRWDNLVQLSTINIYMRELKPEELKSVDVPGMWGKAYQGFIKAINNVVAGLENAFIMLVTAIPYLLIVGVLTAVGFMIIRRIKKKKA